MPWSIRSMSLCSRAHRSACGWWVDAARRVRSLRAALVMVTAVPLVACDGQRAGQSVAEAGAGVTWRWRAERMDISALSTPFRGPDGRGSMIDVRVEFMDIEGDGTKAIGTLTVNVLFDSNPVGRAAADLGGLGGHARAWDPATRTYSVRVPLSVDPAAGRVCVVQATFDGADGSRMTASREVRWPVADGPVPSSSGPGPGPGRTP